MKILCRLSERGNGWRASAGNPSTRPAYQADQTKPYRLQSYCSKIINIPIFQHTKHTKKNKKISIPSTPNHTTPNHMPPNHMVPNDTVPKKSKRKYQCTKPNTVMIIFLLCIFAVSAKYRIRSQEYFSSYNIYY